jgi:hypothetical protein
MAADSCLCACGCGQPRPLYLRNHRHRLSGYTVEDRGYETPCWISEKPPGENGYVLHAWSFDGKTPSRTGAHRIAYVRAKGPIPPGQHIDHLCRVTNCINPDHLEAVTPGENVRRSIQTKLNPALVREIRARLATETGVALAREYGVSRGLISGIKRRKLWADVE